MALSAARAPIPPTALIGREREIARVRELLAESRLVTLTGPGGTGKTRQPMPIRLALSLHPADDALCSEIMLVNDRCPLADVLAACRRFYEAKRRMVFVEYVMLRGVNDRPEQAVQLARVPDPRMFKVNLILYNPTGMYEGSSREAIATFKAALEEHGIGATVRLTRGRDIDAACGQLAAEA